MKMDHLNFSLRVGLFVFFATTFVVTATLPPSLVYAQAFAQTAQSASHRNAQANPEAQFNQKLAELSPIVQRGVPASALKAQAPQEYVTKHKDTTWVVANLFLQDPWLWPSLRGTPYARVKAGQRLVLMQQNGIFSLEEAPPVLAQKKSSAPKPSVVNKKGGKRRSSKKSQSNAQYSSPPVVPSLPAVPEPVRDPIARLPLQKVSPRVLDNGFQNSPLFEVIPLSKLVHFMPDTRIEPESIIFSAATVERQAQGRYVAIEGDFIYVNNLSSDQNQVFGIYDLGLRLPASVAQNNLIELRRLGRLVLENVEPLPPSDKKQNDEPPKRRALAKIIDAKEEVPVGSLVLPIQEPNRPAVFEPKLLTREIQLKVLEVGGGLNGLRGSYLLLDKGANDGVEVGHLLSISRSRSAALKLFAQGSSDSSESQLPQWDSNPDGVVLVVDVKPTVSYGIILSSSNLVDRGAVLIPAKFK